MTTTNEVALCDVDFDEADTTPTAVAGTEIEWRCFRCQTTHTDDYAKQNYVTCPDCGRVYMWDDVLSIDELTQMEGALFCMEFDIEDKAIDW